jgi:hypothetical protein
MAANVAAIPPTLDPKPPVVAPTWVDRGWSPTYFQLEVVLLLVVLAIWIAFFTPRLWWLGPLVVAVMVPFSIALERVTMPVRVAVKEHGILVRVSGHTLDIAWSRVRSVPNPIRWGGGILSVSQAEHPERVQAWFLSKAQAIAISRFNTELARKSADPPS